MKVFLDTNVLASAFGTRGICGDIVREVFENHDLVVSHELLEELSDVLSRKFKVSRSIIQDIKFLLLHDTSIAVSKPVMHFSINDKDDEVLLSAAVNAQADVFVTGDKELWTISPLSSMSIISPREFWQLIRSS